MGAIVTDASAEMTAGCRRLSGEYEKLRGADRAPVLLERAVPGLASVQRQGPWAWAQLMSTASSAPRPLLAPPPPTSLPPGHAELVPVWTDLVVGRLARLESR